MSRAASNVVVKFVLQGVDKVSAVMNGVASSTDKVTASVNRASTASARAGNLFRSAFSGDVVGSVQAMSGALGGAGGLAATAATATAGTVALGAAAVAAAYKFTQWSVEVERTRAALDSTFGQGQGVDKAIALANTIGGVGVASVAKLATTLKATGLSASITAEQLQELAARATTVGASGDEALTAFARAIQTGNTRALQQVGTFINAGRVLDEYAKANDTTTTALKARERQTAVLAAIQADLDRQTGSTSTEFARQDAVLARLDVAWESLKFRVSDYLNGPAAGMLESVAETVEAFAKWGRVIGAIGALIAKAVSGPFRQLGAVLGAIAAVSVQLARGDSLKAIQGTFTQLGKDLESVSDDAGKAWDAVVDAYNSGAQKIGRTNLEVSGGLRDTLAGLDQISRAATKYTEAFEKEQAKRRAKRRARKRGPTQQQRLQGAVGDVGELLFDAQGPARAAAAQAQASRELLQARIEAATNPVRRVELELQALEIDNAAKMAEITAKVTDARARDLAIQAQAVAIETKRTQVLGQFAQATEAQAQAEKARQMATVEGWTAIGSATAQGIAAMVESERKRAAIMAIVSAADAAVQFMRGNIPGAIAGGFAAAKYGAVALGAGAAGSAAGAGRFGAGGTAAERQAAPTATTDSGPRVVNITLGGGFVIGTPQMVGKSVAKAMKSLDGTGYEAAA